MRRSIWLGPLLVLAACTGPADTAKLTLRNTQYDHVNVQVVMSRSSDCSENGPDFIKTLTFVLHMDQTRTLVAPNESTICWRRDRYPSNPHPGEWSGWSKAILFPGNDSTTDL